MLIIIYFFGLWFVLGVRVLRGAVGVGWFFLGFFRLMGMFLGYSGYVGNKEVDVWNRFLRKYRDISSFKNFEG